MHSTFSEYDGKLVNNLPSLMILLIHYQWFFLLSTKAIINNFLRRSLDGATFPWWCPKAELLYVSSCPHEEWFNKVIISKSTVHASICWLVRVKNEIGFLNCSQGQITQVLLISVVGTTVLAKRPLIKDLVLLRTKLLKWSFFGLFFTTINIHTFVAKCVMS